MSQERGVNRNRRRDGVTVVRELTTDVTSIERVPNQVSSKGPAKDGYRKIYLRFAQGNSNPLPDAPPGGNPPLHAKE
jgi:hypothetical protein